MIVASIKVTYGIVDTCSELPETLYIPAYHNGKEIVRQIFEQFINTNKGCGGIAKSLNLQGVPKAKNTKSALAVWSAHCIKALLDNPVYAGKIAYGRRFDGSVKWLI